MERPIQLRKIAAKLRENCCDGASSLSVRGQHFWTGDQRFFFVSHGMAQWHHNCRSQLEICDCANVCC